MKHTTPPPKANKASWYYRRHHPRRFRIRRKALRRARVWSDRLSDNWTQLNEITKTALDIAMFRIGSSQAARILLPLMLPVAAVIAMAYVCTTLIALLAYTSQSMVAILFDWHFRRFHSDRTIIG